MGSGTKALVAKTATCCLSRTQESRRDSQVAHRVSGKQCNPSRAKDVKLPDSEASRSPQDNLYDLMTVKSPCVQNIDFQFST